MANRKTMIVVDVSGSMNGPGSRNGRTRIEDARDGFRAFIDRSYFDGKDDVGLIVFNNVPTVRYSLSPTNIPALVSGVDSLSPNSGTALYDAMGEAVDRIVAGDPNKSPSVVVLTDGEENSSTRFKTGTDVIAYARKRNVDLKIYIIGVGPNINSTQLRLITNATGGAFIHATGEQIREGLSSITHDVAVGDVRWSRHSGIEARGYGGWAGEHGVHMDRNGRMSGDVTRPGDGFNTNLFDHSEAVEYHAARLRSVGHRVTIGRIPRKRKMPVDIDLYDTTGECIVEVVENYRNDRELGKLIRRIITLEMTYDRKVKVVFLGTSGDPLPDWFTATTDTESIPLDDIVIDLIPAEPGSFNVGEFSNMIPGHPSDICRPFLTVYPEFNADHEKKYVFHDRDHYRPLRENRPNEVFHDIDELLEEDAFCRNLTRAHEHAAHCGKMGMNRKVLVVLDGEAWKMVPDDRCWRVFVERMISLNKDYGTTLDVILTSNGKRTGIIHIM